MHAGQTRLRWCIRNLAAAQKRRMLFFSQGAAHNAHKMLPRAQSGQFQAALKQLPEQVAGWARPTLKHIWASAGGGDDTEDIDFTRHGIQVCVLAEGSCC